MWKSPLNFLLEVLYKVGIVGIILSVVFTIAVFIIIDKIKEKYEYYDYELINENGISLKAKITDKVIKDNLNVNGYNPVIIQYDYLLDSKNYTDKFQTIEIKKVKMLEQADSIDIKVFQGQSIIQNFIPYLGPYKMFWIAPIGFGFVGLLFIIVSLYFRKFRDKNIY